MKGEHANIRSRAVTNLLTRFSIVEWSRCDIGRSRLVIWDATAADNRGQEELLEDCRDATAGGVGFAIGEHPTEVVLLRSGR